MIPTCKVKAEFNFAQSFQYDEGRLTDEEVFENVCEQDNGMPENKFDNLDDYVKGVIKQLAYEIYESIYYSGIISMEDDGPDPEINFFGDLVKNAINTATWSVDTDNMILYVYMDNIPELLKYASQYSEEHENSTTTQFLEACKNYPKDTFVADMFKKDISGEEFINYNTIYYGGKFYDLELVSYTFFY